MIINKNILILKIRDYFNEIISREQLSIWAKEIKSQLTAGTEMVNIVNCLFYPFIARLSLSPTNWESCSDEEITEFLKIFEGKKEFNYFWFMKIPSDIKKQSALELVPLLDLYSRGKLSVDDFEILQDKLQQEKELLTSDTYVDLLFCCIVNQILALPLKKGLDFPANTCFFNPDKLNTDKIIEKIKQYIFCYEGEKEFGVDAHIKNGEILISLVV